MRNLLSHFLVLVLRAPVTVHEDRGLLLVGLLPGHRVGKEIIDQVLISKRQQASFAR